MADRPAMTDDEISKAAIDAVAGLVVTMKSKRQQSDAASACMLTAYNMLRAIEGDQFVIGWLESALADVKTNPPAFAIVRPH